MTKFYDARDNADLERVEALLKKGGIEYFVAESGQADGVASQIEVAEEDVPMAEQLVSGGIVAEKGR